MQAGEGRQTSGLGTYLVELGIELQGPHSAPAPALLLGFTGTLGGGRQKIMFWPGTRYQETWEGTRSFAVMVFDFAGDLPAIMTP